MIPLKITEMSFDSLEFKNALLELLKEEGLVLVPSEVAELSVDIMARQNSLLKRKVLTPYLIAVNNLLPGVTSIQTVKNMTLDGRISDHEFFIDNKGKMQITTAAIKRLRNGG